MRLVSLAALCVASGSPPLRSSPSAHPPPNPGTQTPGRPDLKVKVELQKVQKLGSGT